LGLSIVHVLPPILSTTVRSSQKALIGLSTSSSVTALTDHKCLELFSVEFVHFALTMKLVY
ncbi:1929_t:CDS:2, partial [Racocetra persica]